MNEENAETESLGPEIDQQMVVEGTTIIDDDVVASIAGLVAGEVKGVAGLGKSSIRSSMLKHLTKPEDSARTGVAIEVGKREAILDLELYEQTEAVKTIP